MDAIDELLRISEVSPVVSNLSLTRQQRCADVSAADLSIVTRNEAELQDWTAKYVSAAKAQLLATFTRVGLRNSSYTQADEQQLERKRWESSCRRDHFDLC